MLGRDGSVSGDWRFAVWDGWVRGMVRLTEGIGHAEGVAVCFDEVAAFDVGLEVQVGD